MGIVISHSGFFLERVSRSENIKEMKIGELDELLELEELVSGYFLLEQDEERRKLLEENYLYILFLGLDMDYRNMEDFQDQNTILYGHNMLNGSMFGSLKHLDVNTRPKVIIYTPDSILEYEAVDSRIIGVSEAKYYQASFQEEEFLSVLQEICPEISKIEGERILTLSTCNGNSAQRRIMRCRLVRDSNG